jgi:hypothetical protein
VSLLNQTSRFKSKLHLASDNTRSQTHKEHQKVQAMTRFVVLEEIFFIVGYILDVVDQEAV